MGTITSFPIETITINPLERGRNLSDVASAELARAHLGLVTLPQARGLPLFPQPSLTGDQCALSGSGSIETLADALAVAQNGRIEIVFRADPTVVDDSGRSPYRLKSSLIVPDSVFIRVMPGAHLIFDPPEGAALMGGALIMGEGGFEFAANSLTDLSEYANAVWWPRTVKETADLRWWGAIGMRSQDASPMLKSALNALSGGGVLTLPEGDFTLSKPFALAPMTRLQGAGRERTRLYLAHAPPGTGSIDLLRSHDAGIADLSIYPGPVAHGTAIAIKFTSTQRGYLHRVDIHDAPTHVFLSNAQGCTLEQVRLFDSTMTAPLWQPGTTYAVGDVRGTEQLRDGSREWYGWVLICKQAGTSGGSAPQDTLITEDADGDYVVADGGVIWSVYVAGGIRAVSASSQCDITRCTVSGMFSGVAVRISDSGLGDVWAAGVERYVGDRILATTGVAYYECVVAGVSGSTEPDWHNPGSSDLIADGDARWVLYSAAGYMQDFTITDLTARQVKSVIQLGNVERTLIRDLTLDACGDYIGQNNLIQVLAPLQTVIRGVIARGSESNYERLIVFLRSDDDVGFQGLTLSDARIDGLSYGLEIRNASCADLLLSRSVYWRPSTVTFWRQCYDSTVTPAVDLAGLHSGSTPANPFGRDDSVVI